MSQHHVNGSWQRESCHQQHASARLFLRRHTAVPGSASGMPDDWCHLNPPSPLLLGWVKLQQHRRIKRRPRLCQLSALSLWWQRTLATEQPHARARHDSTTALQIGGPDVQFLKLARCSPFCLQQLAQVGMEYVWKLFWRVYAAVIIWAAASCFVFRQ